MSKIYYKSIILTILIVSSASSYAQTCKNLSGTWILDACLEGAISEDELGVNRSETIVQEGCKYVELRHYNDEGKFIKWEYMNIGRTSFETGMVAPFTDQEIASMSRSEWTNSGGKLIYRRASSYLDFEGNEEKLPRLGASMQTFELNSEGKLLKTFKSNHQNTNYSCLFIKKEN